MRRVQFVLVLLMAGFIGCGGQSDGSDRVDGGLVDAGERDVEVADTSAQDVEDAAVDTEPPPPSKLRDGQACTSADECEGGVCLREEGWPGGYCTRRGCDACPGRCFDFAGESYCGVECSDFLRCRDGYHCTTTPETTDSVCIGVLGVADGAACTEDDQCYGGSCQEAWPDGYCTRVGCDSDASCAPFGPRSLCLRGVGDEPMCLKVCGTNDDCRSGYRCGNVSGHRVCIPPRPDQDLLRDNAALVTECVLTPWSLMSLEYEVSPDILSYFMVPFSVDGEAFEPLYVNLPDQEQVRLGRREMFQVQDLPYVEGISPFSIPTNDQDLWQLQSGTHRYAARGESDALCYYKLEKKVIGKSLDLNLYFVGVPGLDAASAPSDPDFQALLSEAGDILADAGIELDQIRYNSVPAWIEQEYQYIRSSYSVSELVERSHPPGDTLEEALSLNVFLIRDFVGGVAGISQGIPGPAGLHGDASSGVVVAAQYYADDPAYLARVLTHEAGHYLGLYHTTEINRRRHDPLADTPECDDFNTCAARENLMFPYALQGPASISEQQAWVLRMNPIIQASRDTAPCGGCGEFEQCVEQDGAFECVCADGLERQGGACVDVDECATPDFHCPENALCQNEFSYARCACPEGFEWDGADCVDIDECVREPCDENATCENTPGSFVCTCNPGYGGNGVTCLDVDECSNGTMNCAASATCVNEPGSARCVCPVGTLGDGTSCPTYVERPSTIVSGSEDVCGIDSTSQLVCWGYGVVPPAGTFREIAAEDDEFCALDVGGSVSCWASTNYPAVSSPTGTFTAVDMNQGIACGLTPGGQIDCWGSNTSMPSPPSGSFVGVSIGYSHICGLRADGSLSCTGTVDGSLPTGAFNQIVSVRNAVCGLRTDGRIACSGTMMGGVGGTSADAYVTMRASSTYQQPGLCAIRDDGSADCWPNGTPQALSFNFVDLGPATSNSGCGITTSATAECWGNLYYGRDMPPSSFP